MGVSRTDFQCLYLHAWGAVHGSWSRLCLAHIYAWYVYRKLRQTLFHDFSWFLEWIPNTVYRMNYVHVCLQRRYENNLRSTSQCHLNGKLLCKLSLWSSLDAAAGRSRVRWFLAAVIGNCWDRLSQLWKDIVPTMLIWLWKVYEGFFWCVSTVLVQ